MKCSKCGNLDLVDQSNGELVCPQCSVIDNTQNMVSEFQSKSSLLMGSFNNKFGLFGKSLDSRERNLLRAKKDLQYIARMLNLSQYHVEAAQRLYNLALQKNFIKGRSVQHIAAAALYVICRREKTPHLLIDFADALDQDIFVLGTAYIKFIKLLHLELPCVDPSLFIHRFCAKIKLQDKVSEVAMTALKFLQSMNRDWMITGRRPTGLCGAAILLACRIHGIELTSYDIAEVLPVSKETIQKRIREFKDTPSIELTYQKFNLTQKAKASDPPSFKSQQNNAKAPQIKKILLSLKNNVENEEHETLSDVDDEEINEVILNDEEQRLKSVL